MEFATLTALVAVLVMIVLGVHIAVALALAALGGVYLMTGSLDVVLALLESTAFNAVRDYVYAVIPLFILMGDVVSRSGAAADLYKICNRLLRWLPGRLAVATVMGNACFGAATGVSVASAATFSRVAYPEMQRYNYRRSYALGVIAGSSALGMLLPPSILMIVWAIQTEMSVGALFVAGVLPGLVLAGVFCAYCALRARLSPDITPVAETTAGEVEKLGREELIGGAGVAVLIVLVLGGLWGGMFTPTEAAGVGAIGALALGMAKGLKVRDLYEAVLDAGRTTAPIMMLLIAAQLYSRMMGMGGVVANVQAWVVAAELSPLVLIVAMTVIWLLMGMFIDSVSIILLTVPLFAPMAVALGYDPIAFAIFGILMIEAGLLTPPFGLSCFVVKGSVPDPSVKLSEVFLGATPYVGMILLVALLVMAAPWLATWLPKVVL